MPSLLGHAAVGTALCAACAQDRASGLTPRKVWAWAVFCALAPDLDWFTAFLHLGKKNLLNHRGLTHSLVAALLVALAVLFLAFRKSERGPRIWALILLASLSHGLMDSLTVGGVGVTAFFPFDRFRYACLWQPIHVGPLPLSPFLLEKFLEGLLTEVFWIGLPILAFALVRRAHTAFRQRAWDVLPESEPEG